MNIVQTCQSGDIMNKSYIVAILTLIGLLGIGNSARAQSADGVVVTVPFEFVAGGATLPAGEYKVRRVSPGVNRELLSISSYDKGTFLLPMTFDGVAADQPTLSFEHVAGKYFLSKIKTLGGVYSMPAPREMILLGQMNTQGALSSSGTH
jgi:hypothetical protein